MSRERSLLNAGSDIKYRKPAGDIEAVIRSLMSPDDGEPRYRHAAACRRHLLMDEQSRFRKKRYNRIARRLAKNELRTAA
jgi:hypothetical protein